MGLSINSGLWVATNRDLWIFMNSVLWLICGICWIVWWKQVKRTVQVESRSSRLKHLVPTVVAFLLVFSQLFDYGILAIHFTEQVALWGPVGCVLTALGLGFAISARLHLGKNWSATVTVKENHQLIRTGPYRFSRHPIYTGFVFAFLGSTLTVGKVNGILALILFIATYIRKMHTEEVVLINEFGSQYVKFKKEVKGLIPFMY